MKTGCWIALVAVAALATPARAVDPFGNPNWRTMYSNHQTHSEPVLHRASAGVYGTDYGYGYMPGGAWSACSSCCSGAWADYCNECHNRCCWHHGCRNGHCGVARGGCHACVPLARACRACQPACAPQCETCCNHCPLFAGRPLASLWQRCCNFVNGCNSCGCDDACGCNGAMQAEAVAPATAPDAPSPAKSTSRPRASLLPVSR